VVTALLVAVAIAAASHFVGRAPRTRPDVPPQVFASHFDPSGASVDSARRPGSLPLYY
jgi:hypothetical protein